MPAAMMTKVCPSPIIAPPPALGRDDGDLQAFLRGLRAVRAAREAVVAEHAVEDATVAAEQEGER